MLSVSFVLTTPHPPPSPLFPYTTLFRSNHIGSGRLEFSHAGSDKVAEDRGIDVAQGAVGADLPDYQLRSEEHTSELQSHHDLVCRLLLEKKKKKKINQDTEPY